MKTENKLPLKLAKPAHRALAAAGIADLKQFSKFTETEIMQLHGIGDNAMKEIKKALTNHSLSFAKRK